MADEKKQKVVLASKGDLIIDFEVEPESLKLDDMKKAAQSFMVKYSLKKPTEAVIAMDLAKAEAFEISDFLGVPKPKKKLKKVASHHGGMTFGEYVKKYHEDKGKEEVKEAMDWRRSSKVTRFMYELSKFCHNFVVRRQWGDAIPLAEAIIAIAQETDKEKGLLLVEKYSGILEQKRLAKKRLEKLGLDTYDQDPLKDDYDSEDENEED